MKPYSSIALISSLALHGLLVADLLTTPPTAPSMASQRKGTQLIRIQTPSLAKPVPAAASQAAAALPKLRPKSIPDLNQSTSQKAEPTAADNPQPSAPMPLAAIVPAPAGSQFVSPFAPITTQPLGRGSWNHARATPPGGIDSLELQRQQEQLQLRNLLMDRLGNWVGWQTQQHTEASCTIRVELVSRQARLACVPAEKEAEIWSVLNGMFSAGPADGADTLCLKIGAAQMGVISCDGP